MAPCARPSIRPSEKELGICRRQRPNATAAKPHHHHHHQQHHHQHDHQAPVSSPPGGFTPGRRQVRIIHIKGPRIVSTDPAHFRSLVQSLTGFEPIPRSRPRPLQPALATISAANPILLASSNSSIAESSIQLLTEDNRSIRADDAISIKPQPADDRNDQPAPRPRHLPLQLLTPLAFQQQLQLQQFSNNNQHHHSHNAYHNMHIHNNNNNNNNNDANHLRMPNATVDDAARSRDPQSSCRYKHGIDHNRTSFCPHDRGSDGHDDASLSASTPADRSTMMKGTATASPSSSVSTSRCSVADSLAIYGPDNCSSNSSITNGGNNNGVHSFPSNNRATSVSCSTMGGQDVEIDMINSPTSLTSPTSITTTLGGDDNSSNNTNRDDFDDESAREWDIIYGLLCDIPASIGHIDSCNMIPPLQSGFDHVITNMGNFGHRHLLDIPSASRCASTVPDQNNLHCNPCRNIPARFL